MEKDLNQFLMDLGGSTVLFVACTEVQYCDNLEEIVKRTSDLLGRSEKKIRQRLIYESNRCYEEAQTFMGWEANSPPSCYAIIKGIHDNFCK